MRVTHALVQVAAALMGDASGRHWGYELSKSSGVRSGVMYPVLQRMLDGARRMGFAFQSYNLLPVLSALENVELPLLVAGVSPREARHRALQVLEEVGLEAQSRNRPNQLSGGQQQRVAIARALVGRPAIIWADEPTGNLDSEAAEDVLLLLERLNRERGQTFVIVTHAAEVGARTHRIVRMRDGRIVAEEVPARQTERALR